MVVGDIKRFMLIMGPTSSVFDYATFALMFFLICPSMLGGSYHSLDAAQQLAFAALFQAGWFVESLFSQTLVVQILRTEKMPFIQSRPSALVFITAMTLLAIGLILPYTGLGKAIGFAQLPLQFYYWLAAMLVGYIALAQTFKVWYIKKYQNWL